MKLRFRHFTALALSVVLCQGFVGAFPMDVQAASNGTCGDATWSYADGTLTISGGGSVYAYSENGEKTYDWEVKQKKTIAFIVEDGILYVYQGKERAVTIPEGVTSIGSWVFQNNTTLAHVKLPTTLEYFDPILFEGCTNLYQLTIPPEITFITGTVPFDLNLEIIYGETGSAAEQFAVDNGYLFVDMNADTNLGGADMTLDFSKDVWNFGNNGSVFGSEYYLTEEARAQVVEQWLPDDAAMLDRAWSGSCFGLSATVVLAKAGLLPFAQLQPDAASLHDVEPTDEVLSLINYYHHQQFDSDYLTAGDMHNKSQLQRLCQLIFDLKAVSSGGSPSVLSYVTPSGGQHAVVAYGLEEGSWKWDGVTYNNRILIWDSNFHTALDDRACLYYDSDTMDYCIPYYGIVYARGMTENSGKITHICNDTDLLSAYPYPLFEAVAGDANGDGVCTVADAVMLQKWLTCQGTLTHPQAVDLDENQRLDAVDLSLLKQLLLAVG